MTPIRRRRIPLLLAAIACAGPPGGAAATVGNVYELGSSPAWTSGSQFTASRAGELFTVQSPAGNVLAGSKWEMNWGCPAPGSSVDAVRWSMLRTAAPSHLEVEVLADRARVWAVPDVAIPQSPAGGAAFDVPLGRPTCDVHLRLVQTRSLPQHARTYFIDHPRITVRDLAAPSVAITGTPGGWQRASSAQISWRTSDNFGSDGIGAQRVRLGETVAWQGQPGAGDHAVQVDTSALADGAHTVSVEADGDGTTGATPDRRQLLVDRTPPVLGDPAVSLGPRPGTASLGWSASDAASGVTRTSIEANADPRGGVSGQWHTLAERAGAGPHGATDLATAGLGDGRHAVRVRASDAAGNEAVATSHTPLIVDTTPPDLELGPAPPGPVATAHLTVRQHDNLESEIGLGATTVDAAPEGAEAGPWLRLLESRLGPGTHELDVPLGGLPDGRHLLRVSVANGGPAGPVLATHRELVVHADTTSPAVTSAAFASPGPGALDVAWHADDAGSGVTTAAVEWQSPDGWRTLARAAARDGAGRLRADISMLPGGTQRFRLLIGDAAGNMAVAAAPVGEATIDGVVPRVADLSLRGGPRWVLTWLQSDDRGFGRCETVVEINGPGTAGDWRELDASSRGAGRHRLRLGLSGFAPGAYRVRVTACDAAGNRAAATIGGLLIGDDPLAVAESANPELRDARLSVRVTGGRLVRTPTGGRWVVRSLAGRPVRIAGRITSSSGRGLARRLIHVRGHGGLLIGRTRSDRRGLFRVTVRPLAGGPLRIGVPVSRVVLPRAADRPIIALVRPRVSLRVARRTVGPGERVVFTGRLLPAPSRIGRGLRKGMVLEWLDPVRRRWRPVVTARIRADGSFSVPWRFGVRGLTVPMRVRIPAERGWPLLAGRSRVVRVSVR